MILRGLTPLQAETFCRRHTHEIVSRYLAIIGGGRRDAVALRRRLDEKRRQQPSADVTRVQQWAAEKRREMAT